MSTRQHLAGTRHPIDKALTVARAAFWPWPHVAQGRPKKRALTRSLRDTGGFAGASMAVQRALAVLARASTSPAALQDYSGLAQDAASPFC